MAIVSIGKTYGAAVATLEMIVVSAGVVGVEGVSMVKNEVIVVTVSMTVAVAVLLDLHPKQ